METADETGNDTIVADAGPEALAGEPQHDLALGADTIEAASETPRDELHDSIDRDTGTLTQEAVELRKEHGITQAGEQIPQTGGEAA
jgi:hypothetical protein